MRPITSLRRRHIELLLLGRGIQVIVTILFHVPNYLDPLFRRHIALKPPVLDAINIMGY